MYRYECALNVMEIINKNSPSGFMIILDNSDWFKNTSKYLRDELNLIEVDFHGFSPINAYTLTTSIFISRNFKFTPKNGIQPHYSLAAIKHNSD